MCQVLACLMVRFDFWSLTQAGVGGWANRGIDPRDYSLTVAKFCEEATNEMCLTDPREILAYAHIKATQKGVVGSW